MPVYLAAAGAAYVALAQSAGLGLPMAWVWSSSTPKVAKMPLPSRAASDMGRSSQASVSLSLEGGSPTPLRPKTSPEKTNSNASQIAVFFLAAASAALGTTKALSSKGRLTSRRTRCRAVATISCPASSAGDMPRWGVHAVARWIWSRRPRRVRITTAASAAVGGLPQVPFFGMDGGFTLPTGLLPQVLVEMKYVVLGCIALWRACAASESTEQGTSA